MRSSPTHWPPFQEQRLDCITVDGSDGLFLDCTKSVMVAMMVHELATNAVKYGALSNGQGRVTVTWEQFVEGDLVKLVWRETVVQGFSTNAKRFRVTPNRARFWAPTRHSSTSVQSRRSLLHTRRSALIALGQGCELRAAVPAILARTSANSTAVSDVRYGSLAGEPSHIF